MIYIIHPDPPANNQNAFFYYPTHPTRGSSAAPADITVIRASLIAGILADISWWLTSYFKDPDIYKLILIPNITLNISAFLLVILLNIHIYWVIPIWPQKHCIPNVVTQWNPKPGVNGTFTKKHCPTAHICILVLASLFHLWKAYSCCLS